MSSPSDAAPHLLDRVELIEIAGPDARAFAHAQFASDVAGLAQASWQWSAWLNAQGRTRCVFALLRTAHDSLLAWLPLGGAAAMRDALSRFVLRAKVRIATRDGWMLASLPLDSSAAGHPHAIASYRDGFAFFQPGPEPRLAWLGPASDEPDIDALSRWRLADVAAGLPWLAEATRDEFVPQALDLERLDAIRFDKGCFPGQEIAARLRYRGGVKQRLSRVSLLGERAAMPGLAIERGSDRVGTLLYGAAVSHDRCEGLAVVSMDLPDESGDLHAANGVVVRFHI